MTTDMVLTKCDRATAKEMAKNAAEHNAGWFHKKFGLLWPVKWFTSVIAFFVQDELRYLGSCAQNVENCKHHITVDRIKTRYFEESGLPAEFWIGDTTVELMINTFLVAFLDNGYGVDEEDDDIEYVMIDDQQYMKIRGETCKLHLKKPYKGWMVYRAWNIPENHGKMKYFALRNRNIKTARNLSGIKEEITKDEGVA